MYPVLFHVGSISIYSFGLFLALGIVAGGICVAMLSRTALLTVHGLFDSILYCIFGGVVGARIAYVITYSQYFRPPQGSLWHIVALWQGGLLFYGAIFGGLLAAWMVFRVEKRNTLKWFDLLWFGLMVGIVFGQTGCLLGGCAVGTVSHTRWALHDHVPSQLIEASWALLLWVTAFIGYHKKPILRKGGYIFLIGTVAYFAGRMIIDIWRISSISFQSISGQVIADSVIVTFFILLTAIHLINKRRSSGIEFNQ